MPMTLYFKRAKNFVQSDEDGTKKFQAQPGAEPVSRVPFWVANTPTFKQGIKDGSIVNLTPPAQMPGYVPPAAAVVEEDEPEKALEATTEVKTDEDDPEQTEAPQAPFGGQPMTPVQPGPKVGLRGGSRRG
jgi:hypothetical protein